MKRAQLDLIVGMMLVAFSIVLFIFSYRFTGYKIMSEVRDVGPVFLPRLLLILLAVQSSFLIIQSFRSMQGSGADLSHQKRKLLHLKPALLFIIFLLYVFTAVVLGYMTSTFLFLIASFYLLGLKKPWMLLIIPPGTTVLIYLLFEKVLGIWLPKGILI